MVYMSLVNYPLDRKILYTVKYYMPFRLLKIIMVKIKKTKGALNPQGDWLLIFPNRILIILKSKIKITRKRK